MSDFTIARTGRPPLAFTGEVVAEADGRWTNGRENNRWHELRLYRTGGGRWVAEVAYRTRWQGELDHDVAEVAATPAELAGWLRTEVDPLEAVRGYPAGDAYAEKQRRLENDLRLRFDRLATDLFAQVAADFAERVE
jgi:hypothetical protein